MAFVLYACEALSITLRQERRLRALGNRILRRIFEPKKDTNGEWRKLHTEELLSLYRSPNKVRVTNTFKYNVFVSMGRFQLELIYLYFPPSFHQTVVVSGQKEQLFDGNTVENKGKLILTIIPSFLKCPRNISILALVIPHSHFFKLILHNFIGV